nr:transposase [Streptomyces agglomeratus]
MKREPYLSDLSDEQWALIEPMITAWKQDRVARSATGDPGSCDLREVVNAIFYQNRTGCQWRLLPHDFPAWSAVFYYFGLWREDGLDQRIQELLRCQVREKARRLEDPSLVIIAPSPSAPRRVSRRPRRGWTRTRRCRGASGDWPSTFWG